MITLTDGEVVRVVAYLLQESDKARLEAANLDRTGAASQAKQLRAKAATLASAAHLLERQVVREG